MLLVKSCKQKSYLQNRLNTGVSGLRLAIGLAAWIYSLQSLNVQSVLKQSSQNCLELMLLFQSFPSMRRREIIICKLTST